MIMEYNIISTILLINTIFSIVVFLIMLLRKNFRLGIVVFLCMLLCPVAGPLFFVISELFYQILFGHKDKDINLDELSFDKKRVKVVASADLNYSLNIVPIQEALIVSDKFSKRNALLDALKHHDYDENIVTIKNAIEDEDTEIAHYSASTITEMISSLKEKEQYIKDAIRESEDDILINLSYIEFLRDFLVKRIFITHEQKEYVMRYEKALIHIVETSPDKLKIQHYKDVVMLLSEHDEDDKAKWWLDYLLKNNSDELSAYKIGLEYYYKKSMKEHFKNMIDVIKESDVILDRETLELIRFYS